MRGQSSARPRRRAQRLRGEPAAVVARARRARRTGRPGPPRASRSRRARDPLRRRAPRPASRRPRRLCAQRPRLSSRERGRAQAPRAPPSRRRTGSCGRPRTPAPARAPCRRSRRRRRPQLRRSPRRSRCDDRPGRARRCPAPSRISAMIASGSSDRGLSDVTITRSARRVAISPISGRLPRSRSPPHPNTTCTRPSVERARGREHVLERVGRVRVVDEHRKPLALVDGLEPARHLSGVLDRADDGLEPRPRARCAAASAPSTL